MSRAAALLRRPPHLARLPAAASSRHLALLRAVDQDSLAANASLVYSVVQDLQLASHAHVKTVIVCAYPLLLILMRSESLTTKRLAALTQFVHDVRPLLASVQEWLRMDEEYQLCRMLLRTVIDSLSSATAEYLCNNDTYETPFLSSTASVLSAWEVAVDREPRAMTGLLSLVAGALLKNCGALETQRSDRDKFATAVRLVENLASLAPTRDSPLVLSTLTKVILRGSPKMGRTLAKHVYDVYLLWVKGLHDTNGSLSEETKAFLGVSLEMMMLAGTEVGLRPSDVSAYDAFVLKAYQDSDLWTRELLLKTWSCDKQLRLLCIFFERADCSVNLADSDFCRAISDLAVQQLRSVPDMCVAQGVEAEERTLASYTRFLCAYLHFLARTCTSTFLPHNLLPYLIEYGVTNEPALPLCPVTIAPDPQNHQKGSDGLLSDIFLALPPSSNMAAALTECCQAAGLSRSLCDQLAQRFNTDVSTDAKRKTLRFTSRCLHLLSGLQGAMGNDVISEYLMALDLQRNAKLLPEVLLIGCVCVHSLPSQAGRRTYARLLPYVLDALRSDELSETLARPLISLAACKWGCAPQDVTSAFWELVVDHLKRCAEAKDRRRLAHLLKDAGVASGIPRPALCGLGRYICSILREEGVSDIELLEILATILGQISAELPPGGSEICPMEDDDLGPFVGERRLADLSLAVTQAIVMTQSGEPFVVSVSLDCVLEALLIHTRCPRSLYSRLKQAWTAISAGVEYPTATYETVSKCLEILHRCCFAFAADFTFSMIRGEFLPNVLDFLRSCQSSEVAQEVKVKRLGSQLFCLLHEIRQASSTCEQELTKMLSTQELKELERHWKGQLAVDGPNLLRSVYPHRK